MNTDDLLQEVDIVEVISRYVDLKQENGEWWGISPFTYPPERTPSFSVRQEPPVWNDFSSGKGGNLITFLAIYHKISNYEAVLMLKKIAGITDDNGKDVKYSPKLPATLVCKQFLPKRHNKAQSTGIVLPPNYMDRYEECGDKLDVWRKEGITDEAMQFFGVKYDAFSNCLVYPIRNLDGDIVNIGGRTLFPDFKERHLRKYTYFKKWGGQMALIFGLYDNINDILEREEVILFEGMKSVMLARGFGYKNCGAILTSHLNSAQMKILAKLGVRVVFALDKEVNVMADKNIQSLKRYVNVEYFFDFSNLLDEKDAPVDKGKDVFEQLYRTRYRLS